MDYELNETDNEVRLGSSIRIPFEPKGEVHSLREELRAALKRLRVPNDDEFLVCTYSSADTGFADLENVLLYNLGAAAFRNTTKKGFRLLRKFETGRFQHYY